MLISAYGEMWARNEENINQIPRSKDGGQGVYVLYDGSMPVYVGKGNIHWRICDARRSKRRGQFWDYFSWYIVPDPKLRHDVESFLLRRLPWYLRGLNRQSGNFLEAKKFSQINKQPDPISRH